jgi:hypothetical protein
MPTADYNVATRCEDVAYDIASGKDPGVQDGIINMADKGGMGMVQNNDVASLAPSEAARWFTEPECPHPAATRGIQQRAAG